MLAVSVYSAFTFAILTAFFGIFPFAFSFSREYAFGIGQTGA